MVLKIDHVFAKSHCNDVQEGQDSLFIYLTNTKCSESPNVYFDRITVSWQLVGYLFCFRKDGGN